ncbi:MAG: AAA family ATPase [Oscillospiraceae bacterium]|nr:AAA family ATPase [Oscillospiraceae bacterium]
MAKIILVASGKGGAGKSTVSALLGETFSFKKHPTLVIELDSGLRSLDVAFGVSEHIVFDMGDIVRGSCNICDAVVPCSFNSELSLIAAAAKPVLISEETIKKIIEELGEKFEYIILDCPAGIGESLENAAGCADLALVVATPDPSSVRGARAAGNLLSTFGLKNRRLVIERCPTKAKNLSPIKNLDEMIDGSELQLISVIWEDPSTRIAMDSGEPLDDSLPN